MGWVPFLLPIGGNIAIRHNRQSKKCIKQQHLHTTLADDILASPLTLVPGLASVPLWLANGRASEDNLCETDSGFWLGAGFGRDSSWKCLVLGRCAPELSDRRLVPSRCEWPATAGCVSRSRTTSCGISFGPALSPSPEVPAFVTCAWCDGRCSWWVLWGPSCVLGRWLSRPLERNFSFVFSAWCDFGCAPASVLDNPCEVCDVAGALVFATI